MEFDSFRIIIDLLEDDSRHKVYIRNIAEDYYNKAILERKYLGDNKNKVEIIIRNSTLGLFVIKKLIEKFHPWIKIFGQKQLLKPDFPKEFWKPLNEGGVGKKWSKMVEKRIKKLDWKI